MSCRTLVVVLLASSAALAEPPPERESDAAVPDGGSAGTVATAQAMVTLIDRPGAALSGGLRGSGVLAIMESSRSPGCGGPAGGEPLPCGELHVGLEPRLEARLGAFSLRGGLIIPVTVTRLVGWPFDWESRHFPAAWGVRVGVGYSF